MKSTLHAFLLASPAGAVWASLVYLRYPPSWQFQAGCPRKEMCCGLGGSARGVGSGVGVGVGVLGDGGLVLISIGCDELGYQVDWKGQFFRKSHDS